MRVEEWGRLTHQSWLVIEPCQANRVVRRWLASIEFEGRNGDPDVMRASEGVHYDCDATDYVEDPRMVTACGRGA